MNVDRLGRTRLLPHQLTSMRWVWSLGGLNTGALARRTWAAILRADTLSRAAELSFYFLLSLFPFLICVSSLAGLLLSNEPELHVRALEHLQQVMPWNAYVLVRDAVNEVTVAASGATLSLAFVFALWTASLGMDALIKGLNAAYDVREFRPWWRRRIVAIVLTSVLLVLLVSALLMVLIGRNVGIWLDSVAPGTLVEQGWSVLRWLIVVGFALIGLNLTYLFAPNLKSQKWRAIMPGALVAFVIWIIASLAFRLYLNFFDSYAKTYGSLGAVIVLLLWLYLSGAAILIGGEVNAQIRHAAAAAGVPEARRISEAEPRQA
jgi:membrane protein